MRTSTRSARFPFYISVITFLILAAAFPCRAQAPQSASPFEKAGGFIVVNEIDKHVLAGLKKAGLEPANICSDGVFIRRATLDTIGRLPDVREVEAFLNDGSPDKRARLIDSLLTRPEFADYQALKWCDILRVKAEFPINLWPNAVQAYQRWVRDSLRENKPYDQFAREMLTASGSNFREPPANFYRAVQGRDAAALAGAAALTFMGMRLDKCSEERRTGMAAFFSKVKYKRTLEWKEEIVYHDAASTYTVEARFPDGEQVKIPPEKDPREVFADWLIAPKNPWFARNAVNRIWAWLLGRGIIHEPDDIRPDNPPSNPELLACLERELAQSNFDLKHIYRLILNSSAYQQSPIAKSDKPEADALFGHYLMRRMDAEVLADVLNDVFGGTGEGFISPIPEPFTFVPEYQRVVELADGSITNQFLEMFGRPARDTGLESERNLEPNDAQRLYLLNSTEVQKKIEQSPRLRRLIEGRRNNREIIRAIYLALLSRAPMKAEADVAEKYFQAGGINRNNAAQDLAWALVNTKEFLYRH